MGTDKTIMELLKELGGKATTVKTTVEMLSTVNMQFSIHATKNIILHYYI